MTGDVASASGIGDMNLYTLLTPWEEAEPHEPHDLFSLHNIVFLAGMSVPTGDPLAGEVPALHGYHLGSGSVEFKFSGKYFAPVNESLSFFAAATLIVDGGPDTITFRYGESWDFQLNGTVEVVDDLWVYSTGYLNMRRKDYLSNTKLPDTGGTWVYVELGAAAGLVDRTVLDASVFVPVYWRVNGIQPVSNEIWSVGIRFGL